MGVDMKILINGKPIREYGKPLQEFYHDTTNQISEAYTGITETDHSYYWNNYETPDVSHFTLSDYLSFNCGRDLSIQTLKQCYEKQDYWPMSHTDFTDFAYRFVMSSLGQIF